MSHDRKYIPNSLLVILGALIGSANALIWYYGDIQFVRAMIPYSFVLALVILIITAIFKVRCGNLNVLSGPEEQHVNPTYKSVCKYSPLILIVSAIFIVFTMTVLASFLSLPLRTVLAFIGSISFWIMLLAFFTMVYSIFLRRKQ